MNYLFPIINLILTLGLFCLSFEISKKKINILYCLSAFILPLILLCIFTNHPLILPLFGLQWNVLLASCIALELLLLIPIIQKKKEAAITLLLPFLIDLIAKEIVSIVFNIPFSELNRPEFFYFTTYLFIVIFLFYIISFFVFKVISNRNRYEEDKSFLVLIFILAGIEIIAFFIINYNLSKIMITNPSSYIYTILFNLLLILLFGITISSSIILYRKIKDKYAKINQMKEALLEKNYQEIYIESQEELFKLRHDLANVVETIHTYQIPEIKEIKEDLASKLREQKIFYTDNKVINSILVNKIKAAKEKYILVEANISIHHEIGISNADIISLISNLMDNAIEALENEEDKRLILEIGTTEHGIEILVKNTCHAIHKTKKSNPKYHGFGLKIIKEIINKYKGNYTSILENQMYTTMIFIPYKTM
ncbi:MAG: GHKL domain-containing protein [Staphylococcus sp.]|nr:GHKL domain-containing protein [Anaeroplasma bactoclasticum]MCM1195706.1 GHKL domain-containing protein [Roseburia sp.]MCM1261045.1 GHKL domain-containing protein [Staphylococcus sp.]MCM1556372.1 GHKL domain-containing protein [Anaeroplasma bactoclasticum]